MPSVTTDRLNGISASVAIKAPCRVATTAAITLSGEQTIDGVAVVANDRVLVKDQSTTSDNGIYVCQATAWERAPDFDGNRDAVTGTIVFITAGTSNGGYFYKLTTTGTITIGTTGQTWAAATFTDVAISSYWQGLLSLGSTAATLTALGISAFGQTMIANASAVQVRSTLGLPSTGVSGAIAVMTTDGVYRQGSSVTTLSTLGTLRGHNSQVSRTTSTAVTLSASDAGTVIVLAASATGIVTAPSSTALSAPLPVGFQVALAQDSTASISVAAQAGITLHSRSGRNVISGQYSMATLLLKSSTTWLLAGDIST